MEANEKNATFNLKQAAAYLGINPYTLLGALNRNEIPHRRIGKRWVIAKAVLDEWLRGNSTEKEVKPNGK